MMAWEFELVAGPYGGTIGDADLGTLYVTTGSGHLFRVRHTGRRGWLLYPP